MHRSLESPKLHPPSKSIFLIFQISKTFRILKIYWNRISRLVCKNGRQHMELYLIGAGFKRFHRDRILNQRSDDRKQRDRRLDTFRRRFRDSETVLAWREISRRGKSWPRRSNHRQRLVEDRVSVVASLHEFSTDGDAAATESSLRYGTCRLLPIFAGF